MAKISLIAALGNNRVIGWHNQLPWHLPADLRHFKDLTLGKPVLMGRKTHESIGRPLPERLNLVVTRDDNFTVSGCQIFHSIPAALAHVANEPEIMVIGGAEIFAACLPQAHTLYLTSIRHDFAGDSFFPTWDAEAWQEVERLDCKPDEKNPYDYSFVTLKRK